MDKPKLKKGFALMDPEKRASAGAKGGKRKRPKSWRPFANDKVLASEAGKKGAAARDENRRKAKEGKLHE
jgi:general stress protein YciG